MKKTGLFILWSAVFISVCISTPCIALGQDELEKFDLSIDSGYRMDELDWNQAGPGGSPNVLSELEWSDLEIYQVGAKAAVNMHNDAFRFGGTYRLSVNYGTITAGDNRDSDYAGDDRTLEFSRSLNDAGDGEVWDLSTAVGLILFPKNNRIRIYPLLGYSFHEQNLALTGGNQIIPPTGPFDNLDSTYDSEWKGFWTGIDVEFFPTSIMTLFAGIEFHAADYDAKANWNLRTDLQHPVSFTNESDDATGFIVDGGMQIKLSDAVLFNAGVEYKKFEAEEGTHTKYFTDGTTSAVRLNEVNWESYSIMAGLTFRFQ